MRRDTVSYYLHKAVYYIGWATIFLIAIIAVIAGYVKIDNAITHQQLRHGNVSAKCYCDDHYWYSSWVFGDYSITKRNGGEEYFYIEVIDGETKDYWTVSEEMWETLSVGDYVSR